LWLGFPKGANILPLSPVTVVPQVGVVPSSLGGLKLAFNVLLDDLLNVAIEQVPGTAEP
jgi:hypothetical protein